MEIGDNLSIVLIVIGLALIPIVGIQYEGENTKQEVNIHYHVSGTDTTLIKSDTTYILK